MKHELPKFTGPLIQEWEADQTKDIFIGMWRPPLAEVLMSPYIDIQRNRCMGDVGCNGCLHEGKPSGLFATEFRVAECWRMGHFDSAVYRRVAE